MFYLQYANNNLALPAILSHLSQQISGLITSNTCAAVNTSDTIRTFYDQE